MTIRRMIEAVAGGLGMTLAASVWCLPCWIPVLMAVQWLGLGFLLTSPVWGKVFVLGSASLTGALIIYLGDRRDGLFAAASVLQIGIGFYVMDMPYMAYGGYLGLAILLWKCRSNTCKIVR